MKYALLLVWFCLILCTACVHKSAVTTVILNLKAGLNEKVYIEKIAFNNEKQIIVDSATVIDNHHSLILHVPANEERLYRMRFTNSNMRILFVSDVKELTITANWFNNKYAVSGSPVTIRLQEHEEQQLQIAADVRREWKEEKTIGYNHGSNGLSDYLKNKLANQAIRQMNYADTVNDPVLFMSVYNSLDFGDDHAKLKKFILRTSARFPNYQPVQMLKKEVLNFLSIYENQFKVNDQLPELSLTDTSGKEFSTTTLRGKYYVISFWSTYCSECFVFNDAVKKLRQKVPPEKIAIVSVAIDDQKKLWENIIKKNNYNWVQLIDQQMWSGKAVNTLKVDSIPSNFFVSPDGKIIGKNISAKDLIQVVTSKLK